MQIVERFASEQYCKQEIQISKEQEIFAEA